MRYCPDFMQTFMKRIVVDLVVDLALTKRNGRLRWIQGKETDKSNIKRPYLFRKNAFVTNL